MSAARQESFHHHKKTSEQTEATDVLPRPQGAAPRETSRNVDADPMRQYRLEAVREPLLTTEQVIELARTIEAGVLAAGAIEGTFDYTGCATPEELDVLAQEGKAAKDQLISANLRLVMSIAVKFQGRGLDMLDLIQEGNMGLMRAAQMFDYAKGFAFSTYASGWIRQFIQRGIADQADLIRIPVHKHEEIKQLFDEERNIERETGVKPSNEELARQLNITPERVKKLRTTKRQILSLEAPVGEAGETTLGDLVESADDTDVSDIVHAETVHASIERVLCGLTEEERYVISARLGLRDGTVETLRGIGKELGISPEKVRRIEAKTMSKLRHPSRSYVLGQLLG